MEGVGGSWRWVKPTVRTVWTSYESQKCQQYIGPNMVEWCKRCLPITGVNFRPMSDVAPSMGPIVSFVNLQAW